MNHKIQKKVDNIIVGLNELGDELKKEGCKSFKINLGNNSKFVWVEKGELDIDNKEWEVLQDIRQIEYGRVVIYIQNYAIINKEITKIIKPQKTLDKES